MDVRDIAELAAYLPIALLWMWAAKGLFDRLFSPADHAIEEQGNLAIGLSRAGVYLAITLGLYGVMRTPRLEAGLVDDLIATVIDGAVLTALLLVAGRIADALVLRGIDNREELGRENVAVGVVEFAIFFATGLVAMGSFTGEGGGLTGVVAFFALGQAALVLLVALYEKVTRFNALAEIADGNVAAGVMVGGMVVALGIVLSASVGGDFTGWANDLRDFGVSAGVGIALLLLLLAPIDRAFLPNTNFETEIVRDRNVAAIAVASAVQVAVALVVTSIFV